MNKINVLIIGSGGREHALAWKISKSERLGKLYAIPGNAGIEKIAEISNISIDDHEAIISFVEKENIEFVIIGPEQPLCAGLSDDLRAKGIQVFGPSAAAAKLEGSKSYAKKFMEKYNIPSAKYRKFKDSKSAISVLDQFTYPLVIKADGLAAGKGVVIAYDKNEAKEAIISMMDEKKFGDASSSVIIEEFLEGIETSQHCFIDGETILPLASVRDYKRAIDNDKGENTGGMGTFSPNPVITEKVQKNIYDKILVPFLNGIKSEGLDFRGIIFIGLMIKEDEAKVIEFNVRFGDPETQSLMPRLKNDLLDIMLKCSNRKLSDLRLEWDDRASVSVMVCSGGYPNSYEKGKEIKGVNCISENVNIFHSGTKFENDKLLTNGGRVIAINALAEDISNARNIAYEELKKIEFDGAFYRTDIAKLDY